MDAKEAPEKIDQVIAKLESEQGPKLLKLTEKLMSIGIPYAEKNGIQVNQH